jgi:hypothetical protein
MRLAEADQRKLLPLLDELARSVEELLLSGLTTASEGTRSLLGVSFKEASRMRLLRLGSTLRSAGEELGKHIQHREGFSRKRLCFFLNRAWLLCQGIARALRQNDEAAFDRLLRTPIGLLVEEMEVVTLGVARKVVPGAFCAFDFRLRTLRPAGPLPAGSRVSWSCVFPAASGTDIPPEGYLRMDQKQGFKAQVFLDGKALTLTDAALTPDDLGGGRLTLAEKSTVSQGQAFTDWQRFQSWDAAAALQRLRTAQPGPLDLDVEMQEEVVLTGWQIGEPSDADEGQRVYPVAARGVPFHALVNPGVEGQPLRLALDALRPKKDLPPLFALMHPERCRLMLQPLAVFGPAGPESLTMSKEKVNLAALLKTIKF